MTGSGNSRFSRSEIGARLREARESLELSGRALAGLAEISHGAVSSAESGRLKPPVELLHALATHGVDITWLLTGTYYRPWPNMLERWNNLQFANDETERNFAKAFGVPYGQIWMTTKKTALIQAGEMIVELLDTSPKFDLTKYPLTDDAHILMVASATLSLLERGDASSVWAVERFLDLILRSNEARPADVPEEFEEQLKKEMEEYTKQRRARLEAAESSSSES